MKVTKELNQNKGITLIALVITIIVMLILVSVTISMAVNGGLFEYAGKAVGETKNALKAEQELSNGKIQVGGKWYASIEDYLEGKELIELPEGLKVGDYVNYTPTTGTYTVAAGEYGSGYDSNQTFTTETGENTLKWRVLSIDETTGEVELIAATAAQTTKKLYLKGADGYNHSVDILNDLCEALYSNENGAIARSIKVEDINAKTTYDYTTYINSDTGFKYGDTKKLSEYGTGYMNYPNLYSKEIGYGTAGTFNTMGLDVSEGKNDGIIDEKGVTTYSTVTGSTNGNTAGTDPYITTLFYTYTPESYLANLGVNTAPTGLFNTGVGYFLASRCVDPGAGYVSFKMCRVNSSGGISSYPLFYSTGVPELYGYAVRPVVSLGSNVSLTKDLVNSTDKVTYWNIEF